MVQRSFLQAAHYRRGRRGYNGDGRIHGVVIHDMEAPERLDTAEAVQRYFANPKIRPSSAHKNFDSNSIAVSVQDGDEAYHAPPASRWTLGYEQAGYARQTAAEWRDPYSIAMIRIVADELRSDSEKYGFPLEERSVADLKRGNVDGVYTHDSVSKAWGQSDHWDPGPHYPMDFLLQNARNGTHTVPPPSADNTYYPGDRGGAVKFIQGMINILIDAGTIAMPSWGRLVEDGVYGKNTTASVKMVERFGNRMSEMAGSKGRIREDGVADAEFASVVAFFLPASLARLSRPGTRPNPAPPVVKPADPNPGGSNSRTMKPGDRGEDVRFVQASANLLFKSGIVKTPSWGALLEDGVYGRNTQASVKMIQRFGNDMLKLSGSKELLKVDGIAGPKFAELLGYWLPVAIKKLR